MLSAYEFARHYHMALARHPLALETYRQHQQKPDLYHAGLTMQGMQKVKVGNRNLVAGEDYCIREDGGESWLPLGAGPHVKAYRHDWAIVQRNRPHVPVLYGAQGSQTEDEQAMKLLVLFFPWVNTREEASLLVPYIGSLRLPHMQDWREALRARVFRFGFPTEEVKRHVLAFCFVYCLPRHLGLQGGLAENSDNEGLGDIQVALTEEDLLQATATRVRGAGKVDAASFDNSGGDGVSGDTQQEGGTRLYDLTMDMFHRSEAIWLAPQRLANPDPETQEAFELMQEAPQVEDHALAARAARAASKADQPKGAARVRCRGGLVGPAAANNDGSNNDPSVMAQEPLTVAMLDEWLQSDRVSNRTNPKQFEFLELVVDRIKVEASLIPPHQALRKTDEPLRWLLHGPPGTGKSHVLTFLRELLGMAGQPYGLHYEIIAFQAVNAADLQGKTIHKAFGFSARGVANDGAATENALKTMAFWRWLIVDEISLTNAKLFASAEQRLRIAIPDASPWKKNAQGEVRPFGGINVLLSGDFRQLPPPAGHYLASVPRSFEDPEGDKKWQQDPLAEQGRMLLWGGTTQGVTELTQRERCRDDWWNEVVDELRAGALSEKNHSYLHGYEVKGCKLTKEERSSRQRVITSADDPRLQESRFKEAVAIVANNDARYQINKDRAKNYSRASGAPLRWAAAIDTATAEALQAELCDKEAKIRRDAIFVAWTSYFVKNALYNIGTIQCPRCDLFIYMDMSYNLLYIYMMQILCVQTSHRQVAPIPRS